MPIAEEKRWKLDEGRRRELKGETESKPFVFSAGASSSGRLLESSGPGSLTLTHISTHIHTEINKNVLGEDRISQKVGSRKSTTSLSYFPVPSLTHLFSPHLSLTVFFSLSPPTVLTPSLVCQGNLTPAASDTIQTAHSPCPTLSPPEPDSKTTRLLPHVLPLSLSLSSTPPLSLTHTNTHKHTQTFCGKHPPPPLLTGLRIIGHDKAPEQSKLTQPV